MKELPTLHILNGDATLPAFMVAALPGQIYVWREILCSGPAVHTVPEQVFWQMRQQYITQTFQVSAEDYQEKVISELPKLENAGSFFEVVLWFDSDLVCQINLLYLLYRISKLKPATVSVCTSDRGCIGYKKHEELQQLFEHRQTLSEQELQQASKLWELYASPDPVALQKYLQTNTPFSDHLRQALNLHLLRFPNHQTNLGKHQEALLTALENGTTTFTEIHNFFWQHHAGYGFGDWQLTALIKEMCPELIEINETEVTLTATGKRVLKGEDRFMKALDYWLGGIKLNQQKTTWYRDSNSGQIKYYGAKQTSA